MTIFTIKPIKIEKMKLILTAYFMLDIRKLRKFKYLNAIQKRYYSAHICMSNSVGLTLLLNDKTV